jgi:hypothetical protein|tara:strand:+ start:50 stop:169 length:120 start_codon:yes stop_codon:yes gene_type:complete
MLSVVPELKENSEPKNITQQHSIGYHIENVVPDYTFFFL